MNERTIGGMNEKNEIRSKKEERDREMKEIKIRGSEIRQ
jgi:hypothetical protein